MNFFKWDLMIVTPTIIIKFLQANGVVFDNEDIEQERIIDIVKNVN